jgi:hypothetical protein
MPAHPIFLDLITQKMMGEEYRSLTSSLRSFLTTSFNLCNYPLHTIYTAH